MTEQTSPHRQRQSGSAAEVEDTVGIFRRLLGGSGRSQDGLPDNVVSLMEAFGRIEFDHQRTGVAKHLKDVDGWSDILQPVIDCYRADEEEFAQALANRVLPVGDWAVYGAARVLLEIGSSEFESQPAYHDLMSASLEFLRSNFIPPMKLNGIEWQFWQTGRGKAEPWLVGRPAPTAVDAPITELRSGEVRRVAQLLIDPNSNVVFVQRGERAGYKAMIDAPKNDTDLTRTRRDWLTEPSLHALYTKIGAALQTPSFWHDRELGPYYPLPAPVFPL